MGRSTDAGLAADASARRDCHSWPPVRKVHGMSATRVCHDCLKNYRRKNKGAQKPWPKYLHHEGHDRLCEYHRAKAAEYSSVAKGKRALRKVAWSDSAKINTVYREAAKRRASGEKYMSIMKFLCAGRTSADYMSITT